MILITSEGNNGYTSLPSFNSLLTYVEDIGNHLACNDLEEVEYWLEIMEDEVKAFLRNVNNAFEMEE